MAVATGPLFTVRPDHGQARWPNGAPRYGWVDIPSRNLLGQLVGLSADGKAHASDLRKLGLAPSLRSHRKRSHHKRSRDLIDRITGDRITRDRINRNTYKRPNSSSKAGPQPRGEGAQERWLQRWPYSGSDARSSAGAGRRDTDIKAGAEAGCMHA